MNVKVSFWISAIISPIVAPTIWMLFSVFSPNSKYDSVEAGIIFNAIFAAYWWIASIICGTVIYKVLKMINYLRVWLLAILSIVCGSGVFALFPLFIFMTGETIHLIDILFFLGAGGVFGFITVAVFLLLYGITTRSSRGCRKAVPLD